MRKWSPLIAICLGTFMLLVDVTIVNVALPSMTRDLHSSFSSLQWVVDAYALTLAALLMGIGSTADIVGHRLAYASGLILFAASSLVCGIAPNVDTLIAARAVQGVGGAAMFACTFALINGSYQGRDRGTAYGIWGAVSGASAAVGPIVGGLLTESLSWRWIFFVNLPVSVAAIAMSMKYLAGERPQTGRRVDVPGVVAFTAAAAAIVFAMIQAGKDGWGSGTVLVLLAVTVVALGLFVGLQARAKHPLLDLALLRNRTFSGVLIAALLLNFAAFAYLTYTSIWLQTLLSLSPIQAGLASLPLSVGAFAVSAVLGQRLASRAPQHVLSVGMLLIGVGPLVSALLVKEGSSWPALVAGFLITGIGAGATLPILSSTGVGAVAPDRAGMAGGAINTARQLGFALGIAGLGTVFTSGAARSLTSHGTRPSHQLASSLADGQGGRFIAETPAIARGHVSFVFKSAFASGLDDVFIAAAIAGLLGAVAAFALVRASKPHWDAEPSVPSEPASAAVAVAA